MVAGRGATASNWDPDLLQTLAAERQVTIFDNRGTPTLYQIIAAGTWGAFASNTRDLQCRQPGTYKHACSEWAADIQ